MKSQTSQPTLSKLTQLDSVQDKNYKYKRFPQKHNVQLHC